MRLHDPRQQRRFRVQAVLVAGTSIAAAAAVANGCSAAPDENCFQCTGTSTGTTVPTGAGGTGGNATTSSTMGDGGFNPMLDAGMDVNEDVFVNPCGTECGPTELCESERLGLDDDCDGLVDETCDCLAGQAHACFKGDPSFRNTADKQGWGEVAGTRQEFAELLASETAKWVPVVKSPGFQLD